MNPGEKMHYVDNHVAINVVVVKPPMAGFTQ